MTTFAQTVDIIPELFKQVKVSLHLKVPVTRKLLLSNLKETLKTIE